ncbi:hypothetical protein [Kitasatospora sp. NPDC088783]|uniref:hypothetical protein n=1 Tax=Kitasatospora sp. NPDC088783 TaxID=3364077 RepID=UPI0038129CB0
MTHRPGTPRSAAPPTEHPDPVDHQEVRIVTPPPGTRSYENASADLGSILRTTDPASHPRILTSHLTDYLTSTSDERNKFLPAAMAAAEAVDARRAYIYWHSNQLERPPLPELPAAVTALAVDVLDVILSDAQQLTDSWSHRDTGEQWLVQVEDLRQNLDPQRPFTTAYTAPPPKAAWIGSQAVLERLGYHGYRAIHRDATGQMAQLGEELYRVSRRLDWVNERVLAAAQRALAEVDVARAELEAIVNGTEADAGPRQVPAFFEIAEDLRLRADLRSDLGPLLDDYEASKADSQPEPLSRAEAAALRTKQHFSPSGPTPPPPRDYRPPPMRPRL